MKISKILKRFRIDDPDRFRLADFDPADTGGLDLDKDDAGNMLEKDTERLAELQEHLYAHDRWSLLVVLQGMDTSGKDGVIKHVMNGINPQGCEVHPFKAPSAEELDHDFLWRAAIRLPARGDINIFNRSYYEEVLVARVHPDVLARQKLPKTLVGKDIWQERFKSIRGFERHLARSGTAVLKFFLHISREEQRERLLARLDEPDKHWKFNPGDMAERKLWNKYTAAYEDMIRNTSRDEAPWYVVPADRKWFARLIVARAIIETLEALDLELPKVDAAALQEMKKARAVLMAEKP